jgi:hypothetical protein
MCATVVLHQGLGWHTSRYFFYRRYIARCVPPKARTKALGGTHRVLYTLTVQGTKGGTHREPCSLYADCRVFKAHFQGLGAHGVFTIASGGALASLLVEHVCIPLLLEEPPKALDTCAASAEEICTHERPWCILRSRGHHSDIVTIVLGFIACIELVITGEARGNR